MIRTWLTGTDLYHWITLRRVNDGGVTRLGDDRWRDDGRRVPGYVTDALNDLLTGGLVTLADPYPDPRAEGMARAALTDAGTTRFEQHCQIGLGMPPPA